MKYILGYSGGIDSTYTAWALTKQGHEVLLVNFINIHKEDEENKINKLNIFAKKLKLNIEIVDLKKEFKNLILDDFANTYIRGETPNPCILCNEYIKFALLEKLRKEKKFDKITTGHYAKIININGEKYIGTAKDKTKDQTYMLYKLANPKNGISKDILNKIEFFHGSTLKADIKKEIDKYNIPLFSKKESQNICFIDDNDYPRFIRQNYHVKIKKGAILDMEGNYIGEHKGLIYYTIGQRQGLNLSGSERQYVIEIDYKKNSIIVGEEKDLYKNELKIRNSFILANTILEKDFIDGNIIGKIRYRHKGEIITNIKSNKNIIFQNAVRAVTPGQHCVIYKKIEKNNIIIGGGKIS